MTSDNPEWEKIEDGIGTPEEPVWWFRDNWNAVSHDGGETYYMLTEPLENSGEPTIYRTADRPVPSKDYPADLRQAAIYAVGLGSVSWGEDGIFDEQIAMQAVNDLVDWVETHYEKKD